MALLGLCAHPGSADARAQGSGAATYAPSLVGKVVRFDLHGFEPDFDPIYQVIIDATLHDGRPAGLAFPDAQLVLSAYLESFQPGTVPVLPDILHPDRMADNLVGFLHGKAALVNAAGHRAYQGSLLAEIFRDNAVHLVLQLYDLKASLSAPAQVLQGTFTLKRGGSQLGALSAPDPRSFGALRAAPGRQPSWQSVITGLSVQLPAMMGGAGSGAGASSHPPTGAGVAALQPAATAPPRPSVPASPHPTQVPTAVAHPRREHSAAKADSSPNLLAYGALAALVGALGCWRPLRRRRRMTIR